MRIKHLKDTSICWIRTCRCPRKLYPTSWTKRKWSWKSYSRYHHIAGYGWISFMTRTAVAIWNYPHRCLSRYWGSDSRRHVFVRNYSSYWDAISLMEIRRHFKLLGDWICEQQARRNCDIMMYNSLEIVSAELRDRVATIEKMCSTQVRGRSIYCLCLQ